MSTCASIRRRDSNHIIETKPPGFLQRLHLEKIRLLHFSRERKKQNGWFAHERHQLQLFLHSEAVQLFLTMLLFLDLVIVVVLMNLEISMLEGEINSLESIIDHSSSESNYSACWSEDVAVCPELKCTKLHSTETNRTTTTPTSPPVTTIYSTSLPFPNDTGIRISEFGNYRPLQPIGDRIIYSLGGSTGTPCAATAYIDSAAPLVCVTQKNITTSKHRKHVWSYDRCSDIGPISWGAVDQSGLCSSTTEQSPVNLCGAVAAANDVTVELQQTYWSTSQNATIVNTGRAIEVKFQRSTTALISGNISSLINRNESDSTAEIHWSLEELQFHWGRTNVVTEGSEHFLDSEAYPLEAQFVLINEAICDNVPHCLSSGRKDTLLVYGVFFEIASDESETLRIVAEGIHDAGVEVHALSNEITLGQFINITAGHYIYGGSFTNPTCNAVVTWVAQRTTMPVTMSTMNAFYAALAANPEDYEEDHEEEHKDKETHEEVEELECEVELTSDLETAVIVLHIMAIIVLSLFVTESLLMLFCKGVWLFFTSFLNVMDLSVVVVALTLEVLELAGMLENWSSLVILARIWRFAEFGHGIVVIKRDEDGEHQNHEVSELKQQQQQQQPNNEQQHDQQHDQQQQQFHTSNLLNGGTMENNPASILNHAVENSDKTTGELFSSG